MRTWERLSKMRDFLQREICDDREYKCPVPQTGANGQYGPQIIDFTRDKPRVFIGFQPMNPNEPGRADPSDPFSVCPAITIMPSPSYARYVEEKRFDRYNKFHRTQDMGQGCVVQILFSIYEPGVRHPGFAEGLESGEPDMSLMKDGTDAGLMTLFNWMDDAIELLLRERGVPGTDLILEDDTLIDSLFTDQSYVVDRRPLYYGFLNVEFKGFASRGNDHGKASRIDRLLDEGEI